ncbi:GDSL-type esterase/lipase family protein [Luteipulveratus mongoliensis]|uniref:GDSL-type esterase/lipase family protein n=1 Tax=Luteipulveratus mongoliensis TaxID=571913 RepID=UPI0006989C9E|nr:GDSL-type esterase/lipase family protein [Luteipulveratus mongoliensis]
MIAGSPARATTLAVDTDYARATWIGAYGASPGFSNPLGVHLSTMRNIVVPHSSGPAARVRLTNRFGKSPLTINATYLGQSSAGGARLISGSNHQVTFNGGGTTVTIPAGTDVVSDPVRLPVKAFQPLAVSLFALTTPATTEHFDAHQVSWMSVGDWSSNENGLPFLVPNVLQPFVSGVDVASTRQGRTIVTLGDSITDGFHSLPMELTTLGANQRYPDFLARRLLAAGHDDVGVVNAGISGNQVTRDASSLGQNVLGYGPSARHRFDRDVLDVPGVSDVIIMEGTNDLGTDPAQPATAIIAGLTDLVRRGHAAGVRVHLGTIPPRGDVAPDRIEILNAVNDWIRRQHIADSVIDFHRALAAPGQPDTLDPAYDSGDKLHPNPAGYAAMAAAIPLSTVIGQDR